MKMTMGYYGGLVGRNGVDQEAGAPGIPGEIQRWKVYETRGMKSTCQAPGIENTCRRARASGMGIP